MATLQVGTMLLRKYRVDRVRMQCDGVTIYDAIDTTRSCPVRVHVHQGGAAPKERTANVLDVAMYAGFVFVVESDAECIPLVKRSSSSPPPLPQKKRSVPPPLPPAARLPPPPPVIDIPMIEDVDDYEDQRPTTEPPPPTVEIDLDPDPDDAIEVDVDLAPFEKALRARQRSRWGVAIVVAAVVTGVVGWTVGNDRPRVARADTSETLPQNVVAEIKPVVRPMNVEKKADTTAEPAKTATEPATTSTPKPRRRAEADPLTL